MAIRVRPFRPDDAADVAAVMFDSVRHGAVSDYTSEQVRAWMPGAPAPEQVLEWAGSGRVLLVAVTDEDVLVGWGDVTADGLVDHLFCSAAMIGRGVGSALLEALELEARDRGLTRMTVNASELARRLFAARGFAGDVRQQVERHGVVLHNYAMHKDLGGGEEGAREHRVAGDTRCSTNGAIMQLIDDEQGRGSSG